MNGLEYFEYSVILKYLYHYSATDYPNKTNKINHFIVYLIFLVGVMS
jgi:hypothetical protein